VSTKIGLLKSIRGTISQGEKSVGEESGACLYKSDCGLRCSVGMLIPSKKYSGSMEGHDIGDVEVQQSIPNKYKTNQFWKEYLGLIQSLHDNTVESSCLSFREQFKAGIKSLVGEGGLPKYCLEGLEENRDE